MKLLHIGAIALLSASVVGCGDDEESEAKKENTGTVNEAVAGQTATTAFDAAQVAVAGDGQAAAFQMIGVGSSAIGMITPAGSGGQQPQSTGEATSALGEGTCDCTADSCTFTDCGDGSGFTITGTIAWTDSSLDCDYTVAGTVQGNVYNFGVFCDLAYSATSLDGTLNTDGSFQVDAQGQSVSSEWDVAMTFNDVTYPGPAGGSIDVTATTTVNGQSSTASGSVAF